MNYYEHHLGDYDKATAHLSACEDGIYCRLIRRYYDTETPIPNDIKSVQRLVRARTREEKESVETILDEFFNLEDDGLWHHKRCDSEIAKYQDKQSKARASAQARWNRPQTEPHSEGNANASPDVMRTHSEGSAPRARTRHQTPDTRLKSRVNPLPAKPARFDPALIPIPEGLNPAKWGEWIAYRRGRRLTTAEPTMRKQIEFLTQCQARGQPADAVIDASIANGWQGLFELKGAGNGKNGSSRADRISNTIAELTGANRDPSRTFDGTAARVD